MKLSVFTVVTPDLSPEELAAAAKDAGLDGIEWRYKEIPADAAEEAPSFWRRNLCSIDPSSSEEELERFVRLAQANGLENVSVTPYLTPGDLEATERVMQAAKKLGAGMIRVGVPGYNGKENYNDLFDKEVRYLEGVQELSRRYGIKGVVETHHVTICPSAGLTHRLVSRFDPEHIGVLFDPGNMVHEGFENFRMGLELLGPYLAHVHFKNAAWVKGEEREDGSIAWKSQWAPMTGGIVNWKQVLRDLKDLGYDGYIGLEDFSGQFESRELLSQFGRTVRVMLEEVEAGR
ncbi:sugar phosphate isomerase/epimerase family protein [Paenibacillus aurantius]|uniref:Sugar phosphate isomerase/epimerase family protein n=1 Tax=Paenibacillus aurantius TaxID=2918900 RepID=A0AA96RFC9_9BACL|nr:sugar phosphate isomerase/epimerase family protein [Paenibacillus aurantius]WNQ11832.1 sugar phosphate isomerase/epimerase family protein [Paenibacillus aurantius]